MGIHAAPLRDKIGSVLAVLGKKSEDESPSLHKPRTPWQVSKRSPRAHLGVPGRWARGFGAKLRGLAPNWVSPRGFGPKPHRRRPISSPRTTIWLSLRGFGKKMGGLSPFRSHIGLTGTKSNQIEPRRPQTIQIQPRRSKPIRIKSRKPKSTPRVTGGAALCPGEARRKSSGLNQWWVAERPTPYTRCGWPHGGRGRG